MPWKIEPEKADSVDESEIWKKVIDGTVVLATYTVTHSSGYVIVGARPRKLDTGRHGLDVYQLGTLDEDCGPEVRRGWEWPCELSDDDIRRFGEMHEDQPMSLQWEGWRLAFRRRTFFGPLRITKVEKLVDFTRGCTKWMASDV